MSGRSYSWWQTWQVKVSPDGLPVVDPDKPDPEKGKVDLAKLVPGLKNESVRRLQKRLNRVTELDEDPFSDPVDLDDIKEAAERMPMTSDKDWC